MASNGEPTNGIPPTSNDNVPSPQDIPDRHDPRDAPNWLKAAIALPVIWVWLGLAGVIVREATADPAVLDKIEGLLTALAVLTIPAMEIIRMIFRRGRE